MPVLAGFGYGAGGSPFSTVTRFTSTGSYTIPPGCKTATFLLVSGGGGGGQPGAGAGGRTRLQTVSVLSGETISYVIGGGGGAGTAGADTTVTGSFGTLTTAGGTAGGIQFFPSWGYVAGNGGFCADYDSIGSYYPPQAGGGGGAGGTHAGGGFTGAQGGGANTGGGGGSGTFSSFWATPAGGGSGVVGMWVR